MHKLPIKSNSFYRIKTDSSLMGFNKGDVFFTMPLEIPLKDFINIKVLTKHGIQPFPYDYFQDFWIEEIKT